MNEKACSKCGVVKPTDDFYTYARRGERVAMAACKECTKNAVRINYASRRGQYSEYEQERMLRPERKAKALEYQRARRARSPEKNRARGMVAREKRAGRLKPQPCESCGTKLRVQAHHEDYSRPLDIHWLCFTCHREHEHGQVVTQK